VTISPNISGMAFSWTGDTLLISHNNFDYLTQYVVTITTGVVDLSGNSMLTSYQFPFTTQNTIYLSYSSEILQENIINNGSI
jgi:hypothetical protein